MNGVWLKIFCVLAGDYPLLAARIDVVPAHSADLVTALSCQRKKPDDRAKWVGHFPCSGEDGRELVVVESAMTGLLTGRGSNAFRGRSLEDSTRNAPIEELT